MKTVVTLLTVVILFSCKNDIKTTNEKPSDDSVLVSAATGKKLFEEKSCVTCHQPDQKIIGPSLQEIANVYVSKNASLVGFLKGDGESLVDPEQSEVMKVNLEITKKMAKEELQSIEKYILSFAGNETH